LGTVLEQTGKLEEAEINFRKSIQINPGFANAHRQLSLIKKFKEYDEQYFILQKIYLDKKTSKDQLCHVNFSLAKINEDLGNFQEAFKHYIEGNLIRKKILNYNIEEDIRLFHKIKSNYDEISKQRIQIKKNENNFNPIFILGMPRSGTTLVEQIISSHSEVSGLGELPFISEFGKSVAEGFNPTNEDSILKFRNFYIKKIKNLSKGNSFITDKMPQNFCYIGLIISAFPEAKILHIKRNSAAVCWANFRQWFRSRNLAYSYSIDDIIKYYTLYEDLMMFWKKKFNNLIYDVDYDILTIDPKHITKNLINHLNLKWDEKCLSPENNKRSVSTASNIQIRNKIFKGSSEKWKKYKPFLNGAFNIFN
jgi:tetratricopeptide (TPR) repeat protein